MIIYSKAADLQLLAAHTPLGCCLSAAFTKIVRDGKEEMIFYYVLIFKTLELKEVIHTFFFTWLYVTQISVCQHISVSRVDAQLMAFLHCIMLIFIVSDCYSYLLYLSDSHFNFGPAALFVQGNVTCFQQRQQTRWRYMIRIFQPNHDHRCHHHHCHRPSKK